MARKTDAVVVVAKLDRLSRDVAFTKDAQILVQGSWLFHSDVACASSSPITSL
jgi:hypothetical protein